jgi:hypothetical protein
MAVGEILYISSRLVLGAIAAFLAIMLWSKTRDPAWMLMVMGVIAAYGEIVYSILGLLGIREGAVLPAGSVPASVLIVSNLPTGFFIAAFLVMVIRTYHH